MLCVVPEEHSHEKEDPGFPQITVHNLHARSFTILRLTFFLFSEVSQELLDGLS